MKILRIPALLLGFGAILIFAPASRAQQEMDPQSFDNPDVSPAKKKTQPAPKKLASAQQTSKRAGSAKKATVQPASARQSQDVHAQEAVAIPEKRNSKKREPESR
jgi:hypothetical protein